MKVKSLSQTQLAQQLHVSKAYISMVVHGKKKPSHRVAEELTKLGVNFEANKRILSHARLPIPTLPQIQNTEYNNILPNLPQPS